MKDKIKGLLAGCAWGDALGMPSEMMSARTFRKAFPQGIDTFLPSTPYDFIGRQFKAGEVTDDTINTLLVCDTIIENHGRFVLDSYIQRLITWIEENGEKNPYIIGPSTSKALASIQKGMSLEGSGKFGTTNGAAMKVSPLGIINDYCYLDDLIENVRQLCLPTHNTTIAITGASIIAAIVSYVLRETPTMNDIWNLAFAVIDRCENIGNPLPSPSLSWRLEDLHDYIPSHTSEETLEHLQTVYGAGMESIETIPAVLTLLALSDLDPLRCARYAANLYGDTDTIGAIATAICGAANPDLPEKEVQMLEEVNHINFDAYASLLAQYVQ